MALTAAAPLATASPLCTSDLGASAATYSRATSGSGYFSWSSVFESGDEVRLGVTATKTGGGGSIGPNNLTVTTFGGGQPYGGVPGAQSALRLSIDASAGTTIAYQFALIYRGSSSGAFAPLNATNTTFAVTDFDGPVLPETPAFSAERGWISPTPSSATKSDATYLAGSGTDTSPWTRNPAATPLYLDNNLPAGTVNLTYASNPGPITLTIIAGTNTGVVTESNLWVTPFNFTAIRPGC